MSHVSHAAAEQVHSEAAQFRGVRLWLAFVAALIVAMVLVGGATRLTESGLSIVEWKPVTGALPPLTDKAWHDAFDAYKTIPQYHQMNRGMNLDEFKTIFWWEWSHRLLGRVIGAAFLLPFLYFIWRGGLSKDLKRRLWIIFAMGGVQGAVGWWMVASGLSERVEVSQYRLAAHLILALLIYAAIVWTLLELSERRALQGVLQPRLKAIAAVFVGLVFVQIYFGALVAGLRAGRIYNTWPLIDGAFIPPAARLLFETPWWRNFFDNTLTVQFTHRMVAYALCAFALWQLFETIRAKAERGVTNGAWWIVGAIFLQATLGILTLLHETPIDLALTHQAVAVLVLTLALAQMHLLRSPKVGPEPRISGLATPVSAE